MNRQELIRKYYAERAKLRPYCPNRNRKEEQFKSTIYTNIIDDLNQLDEPQKPVVPQFVAEWFEDNKEALDLAIFMAIRELDDEEWPHKTDFENWLDVAKNKPIETLIRMKDGYEVEKEPRKYRKKPVVVEAIQLTNKNLLEVKEWCNGELVPNAETSGYDLYISTLEGIMHVDINDYII
ncbi:DUF1642 domain-containing protein [Enterococcus hirae]|uniref:DUF1642 domain-containing protein n=1 Tax=Enterococcus hirae TaxID=1354 RepID=UPI0021AB70D8|nr:DUF1642 domain-containing protein [Enterococcus hirae]